MLNGLEIPSLTLAPYLAPPELKPVKWPHVIVWWVPSDLLILGDNGQDFGVPDVIKNFASIASNLKNRPDSTDKKWFFLICIQEKIKLHYRFPWGWFTEGLSDLAWDEIS
jgi:hypothetical protein